MNFDLVPSGFLDMAVRLSAAVLLGGLVGLDREWRRKAAGMRTHMMVCLAAASFTVLAGQIAAMSRELGQAGDPVRIVEAVTAGVAFLGAGSIFRAGRDVKGLSTGGSIWLVGAVGIACGAGSYALAAMNAVLAIVILTALGLLERRGLFNAVNGAPGKQPPAEQPKDSR